MSDPLLHSDSLSGHHRIPSDASMDFHDPSLMMNIVDDTSSLSSLSSPESTSSSFATESEDRHRNVDSSAGERPGEEDEEEELDESFGSAQVSAGPESPALQTLHDGDDEPSFLLSSAPRGLNFSLAASSPHHSATYLQSPPPPTTDPLSAGSSGHSTPTPPQHPPSPSFLVSTSAPAFLPSAFPPTASSQAPTYSYLLSGHAPDPPSASSSLRITRSSTGQLHPRPPALTLSLPQPSTQAGQMDHGGGGGYAGRKNELKESPQPPSLSPMTISTPGFSYGQMGYPTDGSAGTPITPISPFSFPHSSPASFGSSESAAGQSGDHQFASFHDQQSSELQYSARIPPSPTKRQSYTSHPDEQARTKLKRSHSSNHVSSASSSDHSSLAVGVEGTGGEYEAAGAAAAAAAAKTGAGAGAFVYKVYHMLVDPSSQHLISFNKTGTSFLVHNTTQFASELLPKHFKHSNFSSFVRQLNMYGFHKVNKTPRGRDKVLEAQTWEFNHPKFVRGKPQQLEEIRRKPSDSESGPPKMTRSASTSDTTAAKLEVSPTFPPVVPKQSIPTSSRQSSALTALAEAEAGQMARSRSVSTNERVATLGGNVDASLQFPAGSGAGRGRPQQSHSRTLSLAAVKGHPPHPPVQVRPPVAYPSSNPLHQSTSMPLQSSAIPPQAIPPQQSRPIPGKPMYHIPRLPLENTLRLAPAFHPPPSPLTDLPLDQRVEILELQRVEMSAAIVRAQDGYEMMYREVVEGKRRQDALLDVVSSMYAVLQSSHGSQMPYHFPSHLFTPRPHDATLATAAPPQPHEARPHRTPPLQQTPTTAPPMQQGSTAQQWDQTSYQQSPPLDAPHLSSGHYRSSQETLYHPGHDRQSSLSSLNGKGFTSHGHSHSLSVDTHLVGAMRNPSSSTTLAPPASPVSHFSAAVNTPLPASPHPTQSSSHHNLVGLGLGSHDDGQAFQPQFDTTGGQFYERLGLQDPSPTPSGDDIEMSTSSLTSYAGGPGTPRSPTTSSIRARMGGRHPYGSSRPTRRQTPFREGEGPQTAQPEYTPYTGDLHVKVTPHDPTLGL